MSRHAVTLAALRLAIDLSPGQLRSLRGPTKPGMEIHISRWAVEQLIRALDECHPGAIDEARRMTTP